MHTPFLTLAHPQIAELKPYQPGKTIDSLKNFIETDSIIKLASNENPLGPSPQALQAIKETLADCALYPEHVPSAKEKIAANLNITPDWLTLGAGSENIIQMLI